MFKKERHASGGRKAFCSRLLSPGTTLNLKPDRQIRPCPALLELRGLSGTFGSKPPNRPPLNSLSLLGFFSGGPQLDQPQ